MLTNVPLSVSAAARKTVLLHPNSMSCTVFRKQVTRVEVDPSSGQPESMGGMPTMGGMGVLQSEDEANFDFLPLGDAKLLLCGPFTPGSIGLRGSYLVPPDAQEAVIASAADPGTAGYFEPTLHDLIGVQVAPGVALAFTVEDILAPLNIAPYSPRKIVIQPRDDLHTIDPV